LRARLSGVRGRRGRVAAGGLSLAIRAAAVVVIVGAAAGGGPGGARAGGAVHNPLRASAAAANGDPLSGARFFVDHADAVSLAARTYHS